MEVEIRGDAGDADENGVGNEVAGVGGGRARFAGRRRVPGEEKRDRGERAEDECGEGEAGEQREQRLAEPETGAEQDT